MSRGTTHHAFRADPELWERAKMRAEQRGENLSDVIRRALELYADDQHPTMSDDETVKDFQPHPTKPGVWVAPEAGLYRLSSILAEARAVSPR